MEALILAWAGMLARRDAVRKTVPATAKQP
jgi:hypothetical protein